MCELSDQIVNQSFVLRSVLGLPDKDEDNLPEEPSKSLQSSLTCSLDRPTWGPDYRIIGLTQLSGSCYRD